LGHPKRLQLPEQIITFSNVEFKFKYVGDIADFRTGGKPVVLRRYHNLTQTCDKRIVFNINDAS